MASIKTSNKDLKVHRIKSACQYEISPLLDLLQFKYLK